MLVALFIITSVIDKISIEENPPIDGHFTYKESDRRMNREKMLQMATRFNI